MVSIIKQQNPNLLGLLWKNNCLLNLITGCQAFDILDKSSMRSWDDSHDVLLFWDFSLFTQGKGQ